MTAVAVLLVTSGCAVWRIGQSVEMARASKSLQQRPADATVRLLVVGDSTGVGTGASGPATSVAGLLAREHPKLWIDNRSQDGAKFADVLQQLSGSERYDIVLVLAGGNDVIRLTGEHELRIAVDSVVQRAREKADRVLLMPAGNVGNAPFFFPPLSWLMARRSRTLHAVVREIAQHRDAVYVGLYQERENDPFVRDRSLNARDGLHPSDSGYREWWRQLLAQAALEPALIAAR